MIESTYDSCFLHKFDFFEIIDMQTNDILMLISDVFVFEKNIAIKKTKIMIKNRKMLIMNRFLKFNEVQIKFDFEGILLIKKTNVENISLIIN